MQTIERVILTALMRDLTAQGYQVAAVHDGEDYVMPGVNGVITSFTPEMKMVSFQASVASSAPTNIVRAMTVNEAFDAIESVDECTLHFTRHNALTWGNRGVLLILGNGEDVISDYHSPRGEEPFGTIIDALSDRITAGQLP